ncbi:zinc carboxypeptidase [Motilibacter sp. E257]|uniref:Zinc carboxypeptidase n=2 Tax=Motilibacter deserti TaxID=2714956 RepID=A0ABX0GZC0_9ACTN|nr:zinc carboxypeptidase [Motilibacter deserti]
MAAPSGATARPQPSDHLDVYAGVVDRAKLSALLDLGVDRRELDLAAVRGAAGKVRVEATLSQDQADALADQGVELEPKLIDGETVAQRASAAAEDYEVFRKYSGPGGLKEEMEQQAAAHPRITKLVTIGKTVQGQDIVAVKVGRNADTRPDGSEPTTIFLGAQHAREWITPEMIRRLLDHVLTGYDTDPQIRRLVNRTEMWFIPVANPDGYDWTFEEDQRLWRKNLRDNDGDGEITSADGVDLNRNFPTRWGYDNEGSSPVPAIDTYRGPSPASEPETQALDSLFARLSAQFLVNYHSAAELLLHGIGWQVATPGPDDVLYEAMVGDDADPAVPGYDPDLSAELYTTNGDTDTHAQEAYGTLGFTPEMSTCEAASASVPDDEWDPNACISGFIFPDDEELVQAEFEKNVPFALAVAESAMDPDDPVSVVGRDAANFKVDSFSVSYGDPQTVAVVAKRALRDITMEYRINGRGPRYEVPATEWAGGERYGWENNDYYAEYRAEVRGAKPGDRVTVHFRGRGEGGSKSEEFSYTVARDTGNRVLVIANEDYKGVNPTYPASVTGPKYLDEHLAALAANGIAADMWDVDAQGVPHDLGILSHYDAVLWYLGDNRLTMDPEDALTRIGNFNYPDAQVAERQQYLTIAVRDYLNEGGKLLHSGETTAYYGLIGTTLGGIYYGLDGDPTADCVVTQSIYDDCLLLADDFTQYYLGAYSRVALDAASGVTGLSGSPFAGFGASFGGPATVDNPVDEPGSFTPTNDVLPIEDFPQFGTSDAVAEYTDAVGAFLPPQGSYGVAAFHTDNTYTRLTRTYDLTGIAAASAPAFAAQISYDTEEGYDHVIVEARTVGQQNWTTLPERGGATTTAVPAECEAGYLLAGHPWLLRYLTPGNPCQPTGTSGTWNALTGTSDGWEDLSFDLSAYAGQQVEVSISYVTDPFTGGVGVIVDDTRLTTTAGVQQQEGFETGLGSWTIPGPPPGSPPVDGGWERSPGIGGKTSAVLTEDTVLFGFGIEQLVTVTARADAVGRAMTHLLGVPAARR